MALETLVSIALQHFAENTLWTVIRLDRWRDLGRFDISIQKGRSAAAVIISEQFLAGLTLVEKRKLFVGITGAQMSLSFVLTKQAEAVLAAQIT